MPAPISVIIPTLNAAASLPHCLEALIEGLGQGLIRELIVSDGGSDDATVAMATGAGARVMSGPASRGGQLRRGCDTAQGEWLLIVHADTVLATGWAQVVEAYIAGPGAGPACFRLQFDDPGLMAGLVAGWANLRSVVFGLPYGDQGLLVARDDYHRAGGYPDQPLMEDVALVRALTGLICLPVTARTSAARYRNNGWMRRGARNLWMLTRYLAGADPARLDQSYRK